MGVVGSSVVVVFLAWDSPPRPRGGDCCIRPEVLRSHTEQVDGYGFGVGSPSPPPAPKASASSPPRSARSKRDALAPASPRSAAWSSLPPPSPARPIKYPQRRRSLPSAPPPATRSSSRRRPGPAEGLRRARRRPRPRTAARHPLPARAASSFFPAEVFARRDYGSRGGGMATDFFKRGAEASTRRICVSLLHPARLREL